MESQPETTDVVAAMIQNMRDDGKHELADRWAAASGRGRLNQDTDARLLYRAHAALSVAVDRLERRHKALEDEIDRLRSVVNRLASDAASAEL